MYKQMSKEAVELALGIRHQHQHTVYRICSKANVYLIDSSGFALL